MCTDPLIVSCRGAGQLHPNQAQAGPSYNRVGETAPATQSCGSRLWKLWSLPPGRCLQGPPGLSRLSRAGQGADFMFMFLYSKKA